MKHKTSFLDATKIIALLCMVLIPFFPNMELIDTFIRTDSYGFIFKFILPVIWILPVVGEFSILIILVFREEILTSCIEIIYLAGMSELFLFLSLSLEGFLSLITITLLVEILFVFQFVKLNNNKSNEKN